jgi:hypothetical protein
MKRTALLDQDNREFVRFTFTNIDQKLPESNPVHREGLRSGTVEAARMLNF